MEQIPYCVQNFYQNILIFNEIFSRPQSIRFFRRKIKENYFFTISDSSIGRTVSAYFFRLYSPLQMHQSYISDRSHMA